MRTKILIYTLVLITLFQCKEKITYTPPLAATKIVTDEYFGQKLDDPYRYMEDMNDTVFENWLHVQNNFSDNILNKISNRDSLEKGIAKMDMINPYTISRIRITDGDMYFYLKKNSDEITNKLYIRKGFKGEEKLLYSSESYKPDAKAIHTINYIQPSWDGSKIVIGLTKNDEEHSEMIIFDVIKEQLLPDFIDHAWPAELGGVEWLPDNSGFIYLHVPVINNKKEGYILNTQSVIYKIGQNDKRKDIFSKKNNPDFNIQEEDFPIVYLPNPKGSKFMFGYLGGVSSYSDTYFAETNELENEKINWKLLFTKSEQINNYFVDGNDLYFSTSKDAPNFRICKTSLLHLDFEKPEVLVKEDKNATIGDVAITKSGLFYTKVKNGVEAKLFILEDNIEREINIPKVSGAIYLMSHSVNEDKLWIYTMGWTNNYERFRYNIQNNKFIEENFTPVIKYKELESVVIKEVEVYSHDSVLVPLSIIYKKDMPFNGKNRLLMTGYGSYGISDTPYLSTSLLHWIIEGGVFATAHVRGGGEKGELWHKAGYKTTKYNTWKDFNACTEYLIEKKYTSSNNTAIWSGSAGGILIGRAITERPDLYAAAIARVGAMNTVRFEFGPNGKNNTKEFGTVNDSTEFKGLLEMDSYHHVMKGEEYPAMLLTAGMVDARVPAWQPAKFVARVQAANASEEPILLITDFEGGHGMQANKDKRYKEIANILAFALWQTGHPDYQPK